MKVDISDVGSDTWFERFHGRPRKQYTDFKLCYGLYKEQIEEANAWAKKHDEEKHIKTGQKIRYSGAIGGAYTWSFTSTSIGQVATLECSCGEKIDVSDYDNW